MTVKRLRLQNFTAFQNTEFEFSSGVNVLIGANGTGKTHLMKVIYSILKACERAQLEHIESTEPLNKLFYDKLMGVFKPDSIGRLIYRAAGNNHADIHLEYENSFLDIKLTTRKAFAVTHVGLPNPTPSIYLPNREFLSISEGFIAAYQKRETSLDETYYDLSVALNALPLLGPRLEEVKRLIDPLEEAIRGKVIQENGRFYVKLPEGKLEAQLVSEGYLKLAGLTYLIRNGSLTQNGILFWDEPEANLNPKLIPFVVKTLKVLAQSGIQIFLATHDYLLSQELSALAETQKVSIKFFVLSKRYKRHSRDREAGVSAEIGNTLAEIEHNPIVDEFAAYYDRQVENFQSS
ncbi:MAG: AAA family ATPase [Caldilineaceae bacterium]